jgi:uncharacterized protein (TIGR03437 family)
MPFLQGFAARFLPTVGTVKHLLPLLLLLACLAGPAAAQVPGIKTDLGPYAEPPAPPLPGAGGTLTDAVFGTQIMRVTDQSDASEAGTAYSYWPTFNRDSTRLLVHYADGTPRLYAFDPAAFRLGAKDLPPQPPASDGGMGVASWEDATWSGLDPNKLFVHRGVALFAYDAAARSYAKLFDLTSQFPAGSYFLQMSVSRDDDTFAFTVRDAAYAVSGYVVYRRSAARLVVNERVTTLDEVQVDKTGRYLVVKTGAQGRGAVEVRVFDMAAGGVTDLTDDAPDYAPGHSDNGGGTVIGGDNWMNRITFRRLSTPHVIVPILDMGSHWGNDNHVSMLADDEAWALVSFFGTAAAGVLQRELVLVATDGSGRVRRLAHHHSILKDYLDSPRANISRDGRFVAFTSNWGGTARRDLFVARTGSAPVSTPTPTPTATPTPTPNPTALQSTALVAAAHATATAMAAGADNSGAQFDSLIASIEGAYAVFVTEQHRVASGEQAEKALRSAHLFVRAAKALSLARRHPAGVQNRLQIGASRLGQVWNMLTAAAAGGVQALGGEQAHAPSTNAPPIIGPALTVSGASRASVVAPGSYATVFGNAEQSPLGGAGEGAALLRADALPFELAGASVTINGVAAQLFHAARSRVSFLVPADLAEGEAEVIVTSQDGYVSRGTVTIARVMPGLFTRDAGGGDAVAYNSQAAAGADGSFDVHANDNLGPDKRARAFLFATGMSADASLNVDHANDVRGINSQILPNFAESVVVEARTSDARVFRLPVEFAGAGRTPGIDQITVVLVPELRGAGRVELTLVVAGRRSNTAAVNVR